VIESLVSKENSYGVEERLNRSISWMTWENLCKTLEEGGIGIKDVKKFNGALLVKWKWRLVSEEKGKWKYVL